MTEALTTAWPTILAAFLASLVEFVEALTIVLAVGTVRGWRPALAGTFAAAALLAVLVAAFGPHLTRLDPHVFQLVVGVLLLLFGLRWLQKAILRAAGVVALRDEAKKYAEAEAAMRGGTVSAGFDTGAALAAFNGVFIEGIEVIFIVLTLGAVGHQLIPGRGGSGRGGRAGDPARADRAAAADANPGERAETGRGRPGLSLRDALGGRGAGH